MTMTTVTDPNATSPVSVRHSRPSFEGANIRTWIGFKHFIYLAEQAVLSWLAEHAHSSRELYLDYGLGFEIVDCSVQLPAVLELDDDVRAEVTAVSAGRLAVQLTVHRDGRAVTVLRGKIVFALVREPSAAGHRPAPGLLAGLEVDDVAHASTVSGRPDRQLSPGGSAESALRDTGAAFLWSWRAPYFYCHYSDRVQHSGFVRALEEVVDRALAARGISVGRLLTERSWIPVVSRCRIQLIAATHMEETVHTVFTVTDVLRGVMFDGRMDCFVERGDRMVAVATARILHGYAIAAGAGAGTMATLDDEVRAALLGGTR